MEPGLVARASGGGRSSRSRGADEEEQEFRRLCQRIARNDPSLTVVSLTAAGDGNGEGGWGDGDAERFAEAMARNTVVDRVEIPVTVVANNGGSNRCRGGSVDGGPHPAPSHPEPTAPLGGRAGSLLRSLSASTRVGRALLRVSEVHLVGCRGDHGCDDGGGDEFASSDDGAAVAGNIEGEGGGDGGDGGGFLLLHVLLNVLGASAALWRLRLVDVGLCPASALGLSNLLSRTRSLKSLDFVRCGAVPRSCVGGENRFVVPEEAAESGAQSAPGHASPPEVVANLVYRAMALNQSIEDVAVEHASSREGSFLILGAVTSGLLQRQTIQRQKSRATAATAGRGRLRVFELRLSRLGGGAVPASLWQLLETTSARDLRIFGGAAPGLPRILEACCRNFARCDDGDGASPGKLCLKGCAVSPGDVARMCEHLSGATSLTELAMREMDLGLEGVRRLARALASPDATLQALDLFDVHVGGPSRNGSEAVASLFRDAMRTNQHLRALRLGELPLGTEAGGSVHLMETIRSSPQLRELDLFHVPDLDLQLLAASCGNLTRLGLQLCCCGVGPHRLSQFLTALQARAPSLAELDLSSNRFGNSEAVVLGVHVRRSTALRRLALDHNDITDAGAAVLFRSLANHPAMAELSLSGNRLGGPAVVALLEALPATQLRRLALWWDDGNDEETSPAARALIRSLASNSSLVGLNLENSVGRAYRPFIEYYLCRNRLYPWLHEHQLDASVSPVSSALWPQALARLSRKEASAAYFVMREKLPTWKTNS